MSGFYGWTYANRINPKMKRKGRNTRNRYRTQGIGGEIRLNMKRKQHPVSRDTIGMVKKGRIIVILLLIVISLTVLSKESQLGPEIWGYVLGLFETTATTKEGTNQSIGKKTIKPELLKNSNKTSESGMDIQFQMQAEPIAILSDHGLFVLDKNGAVWPISPASSAESFPLITGISVKEVPGKIGVVLKSNVNIQMVKQVLKQPFVEQLSEIHFDKKELILYTRDGMKMKFETTNSLQKNLYRLNAVLEDIRVKNKKIAMVDLRYDQHIVVRPKRRR